MNAPKPVTEEELHAFADGHLPAGEMARIAAWLEDHPDEAHSVEMWRRQNRDIQAMFDGYRQRLPDDAAMMRGPAKTPATSWSYRAAIAAAGICLFAAGGVTGHFLQFSTPGARLDASLQEEASSAFLIYAREVRHPVEVRADEKDHLVTWLGKRLGHKFAAPDLTGLGFSLVGGRLVPVNGKAGALIMYEDAAGKRVTLMVGQSRKNAVTSFRFAAAGPVETFYWIDDRLSFAVTGEIPRDLLRRVADICYQQFDA
jgi:anti-sigma factor RsiW